MLDEHRRMQLKTVSGEKIEVEVNFSNNKKVKDCGILRFHLGEKTYDFKRKDLMALMMLVGDDADHDKMVPVKVGNIKKIQRMLTFEWTASRNYEKGERVLVKAPWIDEAPSEQEIMAGKLFRNKKVYTK